MIRWLIVPLFLSLAALAGCCTQRTSAPPVAPPPPIPLEDQLRQLNDRAVGLPDLKGHAKVTLTYFDPDGNKHTHDADGTFFLRQHMEDPANPADMLLLGRVVGQDAFEAGTNRTNYWMAVRLDVKRAYVGSVANMGNVAIAAMPLRADRVAELMGLVPLRNSAQQHIAMLVKDALPTNEIYVSQLLPDGLWHIERVLVVNRATGHVIVVSLYNPDGTMLARAGLTKFAPIAYSQDQQTPVGLGQQAFPMRIEIDYPDRNSNHTARVLLDFGDLTIVPPMAEQRFAMPDFTAQGLKVIDLDKASK